MRRDKVITWKMVKEAPDTEQLTLLRKSVDAVVEFLAFGTQSGELLQASAKAEKVRRERLSIATITFTAAIIGSSLSGLIVNYLSCKLGITK